MKSYLPEFEIAGPYIPNHEALDLYNPETLKAETPNPRPNSLESGKALNHKPEPKPGKTCKISSPNSPKHQAPTQISSPNSPKHQVQTHKP